jgi:hypothetical protein
LYYIEKVDYLGATRRPINRMRIAYSPNFDVFPVEDAVARRACEIMALTVATANPVAPMRTPTSLVGRKHRHPQRSDRVFNNITIHEEEPPGVLERLRPYMILGLTHYADMVLGLKNGTKARSKA